MAADRNSDGLHQSATHLPHRAAQCAMHLFRREVKDDDLTPRQLVVLSVISQMQGANQLRLTERTGIDRSTLSDIVRRLQGWLQRSRRREDARAYAVRLTDEGRVALRAAMPIGRLEAVTAIGCCSLCASASASRVATHTTARTSGSRSRASNIAAAGMPHTAARLRPPAQSAFVPSLTAGSAA